MEANNFFNLQAIDNKASTDTNYKRLARMRIY